MANIGIAKWQFDNLEELSDEELSLINGGVGLFVPVYDNPNGTGTPTYLGVGENNGQIETPAIQISNNWIRDAAALAAKELTII